MQYKSNKIKKTKSLHISQFLAGDILTGNSSKLIKKHKQTKKQTTKTKKPTNIFLETLSNSRAYEIISSFYNLYSPIESKIIHYTDSATKKLDKLGWTNMRLGAGYPLDGMKATLNGWRVLIRFKACC